MGIKRVVDSAFWRDSKVEEEFTPEDKYFMLFLLTNPATTQLGIYEMSIKNAAYYMGYSLDTVRSLIERFEKTYGVVIWSADTREIAVKNFLRHSIIKGGAPVRDCLIKEMKSVKNKTLISKVFSHIKQYEDLNETVKNIIAEYEEKNGLLNYSNEKENVNDNENENDNEVSYPDSYNDSSYDTFKKKINYQQIVDMYNKTCVSLSRVTVLSDRRKRAIKARLNTYTVDQFAEVFKKAESSSFLKGESSKWRATFDWLIEDGNFAKVLDGNYEDKAPVKKKGDSWERDWNDRNNPYLQLEEMIVDWAAPKDELE